MLKSSSIFKRNDANLVEKNDVWKKTKNVHSQIFNALNMQKKNWFVLILEHINFAINEKYSKKYYDDSNY
jgi:hypothetical protein